MRHRRLATEAPGTAHSARICTLNSAPWRRRARLFPNGSSIALLLEHKGASALLCADAFPGVMVAVLQALAGRRGLTGPLSVDAIKLSHHGSRANVTSALMRAVQAKHFIVSTNNAYFNYPDEEAVARVIVGNKKAKLWFNHDTPRNRVWEAPDLKSRYGYETGFPDQPSDGVILDLPAKRKARTVKVEATHAPSSDHRP